MERDSKRKLKKKLEYTSLFWTLMQKREWNGLTPRQIINTLTLAMKFDEQMKGIINSLKV